MYHFIVYFEYISWAFLGIILLGQAFNIFDRPNRD